MKRRTVMISGIAILAASALYAHDLFLKLDSYFLPTNSTVRIPAINGTFSTSEGPLAPNRIIDISIVSPAGRARLDTTAWTIGADTSFLDITTSGAGTYVVGVSTRTNEIGLTGQQFNQYLKSDGIPDVLEARKRRGASDEERIRERYAKHVKAVFQVGDSRTGEFNTQLGYPAEIVLLNNPYEVAVGGELRVRCLVDGKPVANQYVVAGGEHDGTTLPETAARTDQHGEATFRLDAAGRWWIRFINMTKSDDPEIDYRSKWATITFEIR